MWYDKKSFLAEERKKSFALKWVCVAVAGCTWFVKL